MYCEYHVFLNFFICLFLLVVIVSVHFMSCDFTDGGHIIGY